MATAEQIAYVQQELSLGETPESIPQKLISGGWQESDAKALVSQAIRSERSTLITAHPSILQIALSEVGSLSKITWGQYRKSFKLYIGIQAIQLGFLLLFAIAYLLFGFTLTRFFPIDSFDIYKNPLLLLFILPTYLVGLFLTFLPTAALYLAVVDTDKRSPFLEYFKKGFRSLLRVSLSLIVPGIIAAITSGMFAIFIILLLKLTSAWPLFTVVLIVMGFVGMIFIVAETIPIFIFTPYIVLTENQGVLVSVKLSRKYGRNHLTRIFLHVILLGLFISLVNFLPVIGTFINLFVTTPFIFIYNFQLLLLCKQYWSHADRM